MSYIPEGYFIDKGYTFGLEQMFYQKLMTQHIHNLQEELTHNILRDTFLECDKGTSKKDIKKILYKYCDKEIDSWHRRVVDDPVFKDCSMHRDENQVFILFSIINTAIYLDNYVDFLDGEINR